MDVNELPVYDMSDNPTGCCPRFQPEPWDGQELHFQDKLFVRATTRSIAHIPVNMASVFDKTLQAIQDAGAQSDNDFVVLSRDQSAWSAEHFFAVTKAVPGQKMVHLSGDFLTKVFEGAFRELPKWYKQLAEVVKSKNQDASKTYFFYTTCPTCAKVYGKNYVVGLAQVG